MHEDERRGNSDMWIEDNKGSHTTCQDSRDMKWTPCEKLYRWATRCCDGNKTRREKNGMTLNSKFRSAQESWRDARGKADRIGPSLHERATYTEYCAHCAGRLRLQPCSVRKTWERNVSFHLHRVTHVVTYVHRGIRAPRRGSVERFPKQMSSRRVWWEAVCVPYNFTLSLQV